MPFKPPFLKHALLYRKLVSSAWLDISAEPRAEFVDAILDWNVDRAREAQAELLTLGPVLVDQIAEHGIQICASIIKASDKFWAKHAETEREAQGVSTAKTHRVRVRKADEVTLDLLVERQIEAFLAKFPDRILSPDLRREVELMAASPMARDVDIERIAQRLEVLMKAEKYWDDLSQVQIARMWQANGIFMAETEGVKRVQIVEMVGDKRTCPVCVIAHGQEIEVGRAADKLRAGLKLTDPDEYVAFWPFPRFPEVQLWSPEDWTRDGRFPPFHNRCRGQVRYLY